MVRLLIEIIFDCSKKCKARENVSGFIDNLEARVFLGISNEKINAERALQQRKRYDATRLLVLRNEKSSICLTS